MKKLRPTIPVSEWKLAINLKETQAIQNQEENPCYGCDCKSCKNWANYHPKILPRALHEELLRTKIKLETPTDLYEFKHDENTSSIRVIYHVVGKVLNGPSTWVNTEIGETLMYQKLRDDPYLSLVIFPQNQYFGYSPSLKNKSADNIIRIDFRLDIPHSYIKTKSSSD